MRKGAVASRLVTLRTLKGGGTAARARQRTPRETEPSPGASAHTRRQRVRSERQTTPTRKGRLVVLAMKRKLSRSHQVALRSPSQATSHHSS